MTAAHPLVFSFPESHFFRKVWGRLWPYRRVGLVSPRAAAKAIDRLCSDLELDRPSLMMPVGWPLFKQYGRVFVQLVDAACLRAGATIWVEKSPIHLHCTDHIESVVPGARFVHVLRDGRDVTASLFERCLRDPGRWLGQVLPRRETRAWIRKPSRAAILGGVVRRWNEDIRRTLEAQPRERHHILTYEDLVAAPEPILTQLCVFLGLDFEAAMLQQQVVAAKVIGWRGGFEHMRGPLEPLAVRGSKFEDVFDASERRWVADHLIAEGDVSQLFGAPSDSSGSWHAG